MPRTLLGVLPLLCVCLLGMFLNSSAVRLPQGPSRTTRRPITATIVEDPSAHGTISTASAPERVVTNPIIYARKRRTYRADRVSIAADVPSGATVPGEYIVIYKTDVKDVEAATTETQVRVAQVAAAAAATDSVTVSEAGEAAVTILSTTQAPEGIPSQALVEAPAELDPKEVTATIMALPGVESVVQNRIVRIQARHLRQSGDSDTAGTCFPAYYAAAVQVKAAPGVNLSWPNCITSSSAIAMFGERCGTKMDRFRWTGIFSFDPSTGQQLRNCVYLRSTETDATNLSKFFGDCGSSPTMFSGVPTTVCLEGADSACASESSLTTYSVQTNQPLCSDSRSTRVTFQGVACGPNNALIQWNKMSPTGCSAVSRSATNAKDQADWLGQCGVQPFQIVGLPSRVCGRFPGGSAPPPPTPPPSPSMPPTPPPPPVNPNPPTGVLPKAALMAGESTANWGMAAVGAYDQARNTVVDIRSAVSSTNMRVVTIDTGAEMTHPDLNVVEFIDFWDAPGSTYYGRDGNGHGTHVAGIIAAKNQGSGLFGVVPGMPIIAMKTLGASGSGSLDVVYKAYAKVLEKLQNGEKIAAINLSLGAAVTDQNAIQIECNWVSKLAAYGTAVVAAAGNAGTQFGSTIPTRCPDAMTVTSLTNSYTPSSFSNFAYSASDKTNVIAAPGSDIMSTYIGGSYQSLSGTSMATPFVTGAFAKCALAGYCKLGSPASSNYQTMLAAAKSVPCVGSSCGPNWGSSYYYGYLLNVRQW